MEISIRQDLAAEALSQDTERLEIDITLGAGAVDPQPSVPPWLETSIFWV